MTKFSITYKCYEKIFRKQEQQYAYDIIISKGSAMSRKIILICIILYFIEKYLFQRTYFQVKAIPFSMLRYTVQNLLKRLTNRDKYLLFAWRTRVTSSIDESSGTVNVISIQFQVSIYLEINRKMFFYIGLLYILIFRSCQQPPSNYKFLNFWICIENLYWELREYLCIIFIFNYLQFFLLIN